MCRWHHRGKGLSLSILVFASLFHNHWDSEFWDGSGLVGTPRSEQAGCEPSSWLPGGNCEVCRYTAALAQTARAAQAGLNLKRNVCQLLWSSEHPCTQLACAGEERTAVSGSTRNTPCPVLAESLGAGSRLSCGNLQFCGLCVRNQ